TADSMNILCEKESIIAMMNTSLTVKSKDKIAPIPAYRFNVFPNTSGTAASPGRPSKYITGSTTSISHGNTGVYCRIVTIKVIGKITLPKIQTVLKPCLITHLKIPDIADPPSYFLFFFFFCLFLFTCWSKYFTDTVFLQYI